MTGMEDAERSPVLYEKPPKPEDFGLTEERLLYFERKEFGLNDRKQNVVLWGLYLLVFVFILDSLGEVTLGSILLGAIVTLFLGLIPVSLANVLITFLVEKLHRRFYQAAAKVQPDYSRYQEYNTAQSKYESYVSELRHRDYLRRAAEIRARQEELRAQEEWWRSLDGHTFERELADLFRKRGYKVRLTTPSGDQGVDMFLKVQGKDIVVQCKAHANYVSPSVVRDLFGTMMHFEADEAWLVATSGFYSGAKDFAQGKPIKLLTISAILEEERSH